MAKIGLFGILSIFLSGTPVFADEQGEFLHTSYCYALTFQESDMFDIIGNSHGPTFTLAHGSILNIQPFYNTFDEIDRPRKQLARGLGGFGLGFGGEGEGDFHAASSGRGASVSSFISAISPPSSTSA